MADFKGLATLGKVAGVAGVAIGAAVLVLDALISGPIAGLPPEARGDVVRIAVIGAFGLAALGILTWALIAKMGGSSVTATGGRDAAAAGRDAFVNARVVKTGDNSEAREIGPVGRVRAKGRGDAAAGGHDAGVNVVEVGSGDAKPPEPLEASRRHPSGNPPKKRS
jgi:hypothetical protein